MHGSALWNATRATLISKLMYAPPAWFGFLNESCKARCQGIIQKLKLSGYLGNDFKSFNTLCEAADAAMFSAIFSNRNHVLHQLLPPVKNCKYNLRPRAHTHELPPSNTKTVKRNFIFRMLYLNMYQLSFIGTVIYFNFILFAYSNFCKFCASVTEYFYF